MDTASAVGYYGKLPCKGDFLQRSVPQEFVDAWDAWLQECLHASRQQLEERWRDAYLTSAVWRFALAEGVCGSGTYAGVMVPSVDRVGRYFPLTVVTQLSSDDSLLDIACDAAQPWFDAVESLVLGALEAADLELPAFEEQLAALTEQIRRDGAAESSYLRAVMQRGQFALQAVPWHVPLASASSLQRAANVFASRELERSLRPLALWWTEGSRTVAPAWLCTRGLPEPTSYAAMLSADWRGRGWMSLDPDHDARLAGAVADGMAATTDETPMQVEPMAPAMPVRVEISAWHEPVSRQWDAGPEPLFVERPELGLWGIACQELLDPTGDAAQRVADMLQNVPQTATLSGLVEAVREALEQVQRQSRTADPAVASAPAAQTVIFMARGDECALVCAGNVQAIRYRSSQISPIVSAAEHADPVPDSPPAAPDAGSSLMDLLAAPAARSTSITVRYEALWPGDAWVLAGAPLLDEPRLGELAAPFAADESADGAPIAAVRGICRADAVSSSGALPVLLLTARSGHTA